MDFFEDLFDLDGHKRRRRNGHSHHDEHSGQHHGDHGHHHDYDDDFDDDYDHGHNHHGDFDDFDGYPGNRMGPESFCPQCSSPVARGAKFCQNCGAGLSLARNCSNCGKPVLPGASFCPECGNKLR